MAIASAQIRTEVSSELQRWFATVLPLPLFLLPRVALKIETKLNSKERGRKMTACHNETCLPLHYTGRFLLGSCLWQTDAGLIVVQNSSCLNNRFSHHWKRVIDSELEVQVDLFSVMFAPGKR